LDTEVTVFMAVVVLAILHLTAPVFVNIAQYGLMSLLGPRDKLEPASNLYAQRLERANNNFKETAPLALGLLIMVQVTGQHSDLSAAGAWIYLGARLTYIPIYIFGVPFVRTLVWSISVVGLLMILASIAA
jgi:uncharacterized MAPEG superfamily protein